jgi:hypothetical protein
MKSSANQLTDQLRAGFLGGETNDEIARRVSNFFGQAGGRNGGKPWAMTQAVVRTSMAEASQAAHDAFYEANEDLLPKTKSGYRFWWDASNDTRLCPECAPMDGVKYKNRDDVKGWPRHFSCRCKILPITATMELLEEEDGPAKGSFLEATPVLKDSKGRRLPPPAGYTGDNAYRRPMKIDGKMQWVRRRDLGPGQTTAGDMLKNANDHSKQLVLGTKPMRHPITGKEDRPVKIWNDLIKQEKYAKDPQSLVRKLLGNPLPPGSTPPRPTRGPGPKPVPPATPKAKAAPLQELASSVRKPVGLGKTTSADLNWMDDIDWDELPTKLGYKDYEELEYRIEATKKWTGAQYEKMRASQFLDSVSDDVRKLTDSQRIYVQNVLKTNGFESIKQLRQDVGPKVDWAEELLSRSPRYSGSVYRGINLDSEGDVKAFLNGLRGNTVPSMESWTSVEDVARTFSTGATRPSAGSYRVIVEAQNRHGVSLGDFSSKRGEREILMPSGIRYEVVGDVTTSTAPDGATIYRVKVRQL